AQSTSTGQTCPQDLPSKFCDKIVRAAPLTLPVAILRMNVGMSISVGHALIHGASTQYKHRFASAIASASLYGGFLSSKRSSSRLPGKLGMRAISVDIRHS